MNFIKNLPYFNRHAPTFFAFTSDDTFVSELKQRFRHRRLIIKPEAQLFPLCFRWQAKRISPSCILLDTKLDEMEGVAFVKVMRTVSPETAIFLVGNRLSDVGCLKAYLHAGIKAYIKIDFGEANWLHTIDKLLADEKKEDEELLTEPCMSYKRTMSCSQSQCLTHVQFHIHTGEF